MVNPKAKKLAIAALHARMKALVSDHHQKTFISSIPFPKLKSKFAKYTSDKLTLSSLSPSSVSTINSSEVKHDGQNLHTTFISGLLHSIPYEQLRTEKYALAQLFGKNGFMSLHLTDFQLNLDAGEEASRQLLYRLIRVFNSSGYGARPLLFYSKNKETTLCLEISDRKFDALKDFLNFGFLETSTSKDQSQIKEPSLHPFCVSKIQNLDSLVQLNQLKHSNVQELELTKLFANKKSVFAGPTWVGPMQDERFEKDVMDSYEELYSKGSDNGSEN